MRIAPLALVALAFVAPPSRAADDADADVVVRKWLVLPAVDTPLRRTLRADAVFAKYLLDRASPPPKEGDEVTGTLGVAAKWSAAEAKTSKDAKEDGFVDAERSPWGYASVESAADKVVIAKLEGAGAMYVNGAGFTGDTYGLGDAGVPVALRKGANDVYVAGAHAGFRLTLRAPRKTSFDRAAEKAIEIDGNRSVLPDDAEGQSTRPPLSFRMLNATTEPQPTNMGCIEMVPLGVGSMRSGIVDGPMPFGGKAKPGEPYRRTFVSNIDGSVQSYALVPPAPSDIDKTKIGLVLSLHGAGVECMSQAKAYAPKPDFWIVCPTNRGNYGFDWQDWGRLDAYEVLADALKVTGVDPRRVYLTGHSMGGHGTWHLAANDPGRFLAIAPSAGWSSFENLNGPQITPLAWMWRAADGASQTLDLVANLAQIPTYVLHGVDDDNIPASQAHLMIDAIEKAGGHPQSHFEPGAGHWWDKDEKTPGADCVDWPGIWELFRRTQPAAGNPREISLSTMDLSVEDQRAWVRIQQPIEYGHPSRVVASWDGKRSITLATENVRALQVFNPTPGGEAVNDGSHAIHTENESTFDVSIDGQSVLAREVEFLAYLEHGGRGWSVIHDYSEGKTPARSGPFKRAFANRFVLVYGTAGDETETRELLEKARYDSEVWAYRANGAANLMSDAQFLAGDFRDRNVIVYGNADTNRAWSAVFDDDCPIQAKRGVMTVNGTKHEGVVAAAFVRPRKGSDAALAAAFADTGAAATRMFYAFPVFSSGVGIPDYVVFGPGFLREWDGDVRAAGWFDYAWRMR
jgi:poly(3-hydroxybutyrate) depolymerase